MFKIFFLLFLLFANSSSFGASETVVSFVDLPEVAQGSDVHCLSKTYCKTLWTKIQSNGYLKASSAEFTDIFAKSVLELGRVIEKIKDSEPIMIGAQINLSDKPITEPDVLKFGTYFDRDAYPILKTALTSMSVLGKHKGGADLDNETNAHVNEVFVYVWSKVKKDPERLPAFLLGLVDASATCIQGYTVRMLCAVHPPKLKGVAKK